MVKIKYFIFCNFTCFKGKIYKITIKSSRSFKSTESLANMIKMLCAQGKAFECLLYKKKNWKALILWKGYVKMSFPKRMHNKLGKKMRALWFFKFHTKDIQNMLKF